MLGISKILLIFLIQTSYGKDISNSFQNYTVLIKVWYRLAKQHASLKNLPISLQQAVLPLCTMGFLRNVVRDHLPIQNKQGQHYQSDAFILF